MNKLTILLIIIAIICSGVGGFILGAQNSQMIPTINLVNNTTDDDSGYSTDTSNYNASKYTKNTTKKKTVTTIKKNNTSTNSTPKTNSSTNSTKP